MPETAVIDEKRSKTKKFLQLLSSFFKRCLKNESRLLKWRNLYSGPHVKSGKNTKKKKKTLGKSMVCLVANQNLHHGVCV